MVLICLDCSKEFPKCQCEVIAKAKQAGYEIMTEIIPSNGNKITYKIINGTAYHVETPDVVVKLLETYRRNGTRVRLFFGDAETGRDWLEELDTIGTIGRSMGKIKVPLLVKNDRSSGGGALLDHCIVRITVDKQDVYRHPKYHQGEITKEPICEPAHPNLTMAVYIDGKCHAAFQTAQQTDRFIAFIKGERNAK